MQATRFRVVALVVAATVIGGAMIVPVGAVDGVTKAFVKRTVKKFINKDNNQKEGIFASHKASLGGIPTGIAQVAQLPLPKGKYALFAKLNTGETGFGTSTYCELRLGATVLDWGEAFAQHSADTTPQRSSLTLNLMSPASLSSPGVASLWCDDFAGADTGNQVKLMAIRGPSARNMVSTSTGATHSTAEERSRG